MRLYAAVALLSVLLFGVGWTSRAVLGPEGTVRAAHEDCDRCRKSQRPARISPGPYLSTVDKLQEDLDLTCRQHEDLQLLIQETSERLAMHDRARTDIYQESGEQVRALLTDEQLARLSCIVAERMDQYRWQRIQAAEEFCRTAGLDPDTGREVVDVLAEYEQAKIDLYTNAFAHVDEPALGDSSGSWSDVCERYQDRMGELLDSTQRAGLRAALIQTCETGSRSNVTQ